MAVAVDMEQKGPWSTGRGQGKAGLASTPDRRVLGVAGASGCGEGEACARCRGVAAAAARGGVARLIRHGRVREANVRVARRLFGHLVLLLHRLAALGLPRTVPLLLLLGGPARRLALLPRVPLRLVPRHPLLVAPLLRLQLRLRLGTLVQQRHRGGRRLNETKGAREVSSGRWSVGMRTVL